MTAGGFPNENETLCIEFGLCRTLDPIELTHVRQFLPELVIHLEDERAVLRFPIPEDGHHGRVDRLVQVHAALDMIGLRPGIDYWIERLTLIDPGSPTVELAPR